VEARGIETEVDDLFRRHAGRIVAALTHVAGLGHLDLAEDAVQDAMIQALRRWPFQGVPDNPEGWLFRVARNRASDRLRRRALWRRKAAELAASVASLQPPPPALHPRLAGEVEDDRLRMMFACCHPVLSRDAQVALTLKVVCAFSVDETARAFLTTRPAMAQRLVRAKRRLRDGGVALELPGAASLSPRLDAVLEAIYLLFNEGYAASEGEDLIRWDLCREAVRLAELVCRHPLTAQPKAHALAALLLLQAARLPGRLDAEGELVLLAEQDRSRWDRVAGNRGLAHLEASARGDELSTYHLEAEIAACHTLATSWEATDWRRIVGAYDVLLEHNPSPVVAVNRAVALARVEGPKAGLAALGHWRTAIPVDYLPARVAHGALAAEAGRDAEAIASFERALALAPRPATRRYLERRLAELGRPRPTGSGDEARA